MDGGGLEWEMALRLGAALVLGGSIATVRYAGDAVPDQAHVGALLERHGFRIAQTSYRMVPEGRAVEFAMRVWSTRRGHVTDLARTLAADPGVVQFRLSPMQE